MLSTSTTSKPAAPPATDNVSYHEPSLQWYVILHQGLRPVYYSRRKATHHQMCVCALVCVILEILSTELCTTDADEMRDVIKRQLAKTNMNDVYFL